MSRLQKKQTAHLLVEIVCFSKKVLVLYPFKNALWALRPCKAFGRSISASLPNPQTPFPSERLCMLGWLCVLAKLLGIHARHPCRGGECGAAALTKQGRLKSVAHSRCTMQRHQRLTTRIGATSKAWMLWLLAKSFARCKTSRASDAKHPF